jgi:hypothetical protein
MSGLQHRQRTEVIGADLIQEVTGCRGFEHVSNLETPADTPSYRSTVFHRPAMLRAEKVRFSDNFLVVRCI